MRRQFQPPDLPIKSADNGIEGGAEDHSLTANDEDFDRLVGKAALPALITAAEAWSPKTPTAASPGIPRDTAVSVPPRGVELAWDFTGDSNRPAGSGAKSGAVTADAALLDALRLLVRMTEAERQTLLNALAKAPKAAE